MTASKFFSTAIIVLGSVGVLYLSWLSNPNIGLQPYFPHSMGRWINENWNIRTAVPFVFLAVFAELNFVGRQEKFRKRVIIVVTLLVLVILAEVGQLFLPYRHFDFGDILWGLLGTLIGITAGYLGKLIFVKQQI